MWDKLNAFTKTRSWDIADLSTFGCKWIYKIKTHANGSVQRYKTHLIDKGFVKDMILAMRKVLQDLLLLDPYLQLLQFVDDNYYTVVNNAFLSGELVE